MDIVVSTLHEICKVASAWNTLDLLLYFFRLRQFECNIITLFVKLRLNCCYKGVSLNDPPHVVVHGIDTSV